ncbi:apolipoprotein N-acyltransferase [Thiovulum sp. ES]|nr:apolipoprotein N-acyltransferase [Thiovulum sp. ES]
MIKEILKSFGVASLLSAFIYLHHFGFENQFIETILGISGIGFLLFEYERKVFFWTGFFTGILWFFWMPFSMQYYGFPYLIPPSIILLGIAYGIFFFIVGYFDRISTKASLFILLTFFEPFGFNWFKPQIIFVNTPFGTETWQFAIIVFSIALSIFAFLERKKFLYFAPLLLLFAIDFREKVTKEFPLDIKLVETQILQEEKWLPENRWKIIDMNFAQIEKAIDEKQDIVVLPESTFPIYINRYPEVLENLKFLSHQIAIFTGGLYSENGEQFNATYFFKDGNLQIGKKVVLVPFGEYIPLPKIIKDKISEMFFDGVKDFTPAKTPTDFIIDEVKIRNAICYEGTSEKLFQNSPPFMIVISNNGWFLPSIEPTLQKLLMQHFSNISGVTIFHSANRDGTDVISPN